MIAAKTLVIFFVLWMILGHNNSPLSAHGLSIPGRIFSAVSFAFDKGFDIAKSAPQFFPTPREIKDLGKEVLFGLPSRVLLDGFNTFCSQALATDNNLSRSEKDKPDYSDLSIILYNDRVNTSFPLSFIGELLEHPSFNRYAPVVILITGWLTNTDSDPLDPTSNRAADTVYRAYKCRGETNFLLMDTSGFANTLYTWSALNTEDLGYLLAYAVQNLAEHVNIKAFHVIGHSLGAHIAGATGRYFKQLTGESLPRITGLDPARPCFNQGETLTGLGRGDAEFVDVIHTNSDGLGKKEPIGDVDFYPNGVKLLMPGCIEIACAHERAWRYYAESVYPGNEEGFLATRCNSLTSYTHEKCNNGPTIPMGYATPHTATGSYFLETNRVSPYGKDSRGEVYCA